MKEEKFAEMLRIIAEQHIALIKYNCDLLEINLRLMKENKILINQNIELKKNGK